MTVSPAWTVIDCGVKAKLRIWTLKFAASAGAASTRVSETASRATRENERTDLSLRGDDRAAGRER